LKDRWISVADRIVLESELLDVINKSFDIVIDTCINYGQLKQKEETTVGVCWMIDVLTDYVAAADIVLAVECGKDCRYSRWFSSRISRHQLNLSTGHYHLSTTICV
jgi:hypothetical protein